MKCKQGDLAVVIKSVDNASVGMIVQVVKFVGEHSLYGPIWRCRSKDTIVTEFGGFGNEADFADDWLQPIVPPPNVKITEKELVHEH
jgi:hypothetical protein